MTLSTSKPTLALRDAFLRMVDDYAADDPQTGAGYHQARQILRPMSKDYTMMNKD